MPRRQLPVQAILDAFDGGERNARELSRRFGASYTGMLTLLRRNKRVLRTRGEANASADKQEAVAKGRERYWTPERRAAFGAAIRAGHAAAKATKTA